MTNPSHAQAKSAKPKAGFKKKEAVVEKRPPVVADGVAEKAPEVAKAVQSPTRQPEPVVNNKQKEAVPKSEPKKVATPEKQMTESPKKTPTTKRQRAESEDTKEEVATQPATKRSCANVLCEKFSSFYATIRSFFGNVTERTSQVSSKLISSVTALVPKRK